VFYLHKYIHKGPDRIVLTVEQPDVNEITQYLNARYVSPPEAFYKIWGFTMHANYPNVVKLPCHLEREQTVLFDHFPPDNLQVNALMQFTNTI
jgi:hypothetical protein